MEKTKTVRMPAGIRNKLLAAIAMLLVSSIMMVSSTYAWFTLSTAPEVTGITTSVGANGNLEMALLTTETYGDLADITSAVGDSSAVKAVTDSNITWGNLIDLSHNSYGLNLIALNPAALNYVAGSATTVSTTALLKTAVYGADGRVAELKDNTVSGVYDSTTAKWIISQMIENVATQTRGVRAIGVDSNMTTAEIILNAAKAAVTAGKNGASADVTNAVNAKRDTFVALLNKDESKNYTAEELGALAAVAKGVESSLNAIVKTYSNAVLAALAVDETVTEDILTAIRPELSDNTSAAEVASILTKEGVAGGNAYAERLTALATAQANVAAVLAHFDGEGTDDYNEGTAPADIKTNVVAPLIGGGSTTYAVDKDMHKVALDPANVSVIKAIYVAGGLLSTVAEDSGTYRLTTYLGYPVYAAKVTTESNGLSGDEEVITVTPADSGNLADVAAAVSGMNVTGTENAEKTIADFYGYVIDFAFRTNAADSYLQLQTEAANRVYSDGGSATMGGGSTVSFDYTGVTAQQAEGLLGAVKIVFLNPESGDILATAALDNVQFADGANTATADVVLASTTVTASDGEDVSTAIMALQQNQATKISVLVYLDGETIDNADVANGANSGVLNLNLQFSSSAELIPMENSALKNMNEVEYTVTFDANGGEGTMAAATKVKGTYTLPTAPTGITAPADKQFGGWSTTPDGANIVTTVTKGTTVYAVWVDAPAEGG